MPRIHFHSALGDITTEVSAGTTLLEAAQHCNAPVGHACGGACACSTCHVWVKVGLASLSEQDEDESDRLDSAFDVRPTSRLACQARMGNEDVDVWISEESLRAYANEHSN